MKRLPVLLLVLLVTLVFALPASADQPQYWYDYDYDLTVLGFDCTVFGYDFVIDERIIGHESELLYFDKAGNVVRTLYQNKGKFILSNSNYPEIAANGTFDVSSHVEITGPTTWTRTITGTPYRITIGDEVYHRSGQTVEEVDGWVVTDTTKLVGFNDSEIDFQVVCAAMAQ